MLRKSTLAIIIAVIMVLTVVSGYIASESAQYNNPISIKHGVAFVQTTSGEVSMSDVNENSISIVSVKVTGYNGSNNTPATLPNTSAPHGDHTCNMGTFTVTTDQDCSAL